MFEWLADPNAWIALATLTALEIVLGIDNIIFISVLVSRVEASRRNLARRLGLSLAMLTRIGLLLSLAWIMKLTDPLISFFDQAISGRDIILIGGGLFLLWKSVHEIHNSLTTGEEAHHTGSSARAAFGAVLVQIAIIDIVFSLDSVITAVGLVDQIGVMITAILISVGVMMLAAKSIGDFVDANPTIKMLALSFLVLVGVTLIAEGFDTHVPKGYIYFAMAFSVVVELINIRLRKRTEHRIKLHKEMPGEADA